MTTMKQIAMMLGLVGRSFIPNVNERTSRPDISNKRVPPRSMTEEEKEYYAIHKNLNGFKN